MNKKLLLGGAVASVSALVVGTALHGYLDVMAKPLKHQSLISTIANKKNDENMAGLADFTQSKLTYINALDTEVITLKSDNGYNLRGYYTKAENDSNTFVFFAHGYRADHLGDPANFQQYYIEKGYHFFSVDHTACGDSEGKWVGFDYFECPDCLNWLDYMISRFGSDIKIILHGVSMGGATVCKMADKIPPQVKCIIADCPYTSAVDEFKSVINGVGIKRTNGLMWLFNTVNKRLAGFDLNDTDVRESVENAKAPMLFVHGEADDFVPTRMGVELFSLCTSEKDLLLVPDAPHAQSISTDEKAYHKKLDEFIAKYI